MWIQTKKRYVVVLACLLSLTACQSVPKEEVVAEADVSEAQIAARSNTLLALSQFQFGGGLGVWTDEESVSARIQWMQDNGDLDLTLTGPAGIGEMQLLDKAGTVLLLRGKTVVTNGTSADEVVKRGLGLRAAVPIEELKQWVRGLPGDASSITRDSAGKLTELRYMDSSATLWSVRFRRYETVGDLELPSLITASGGEYSVRLILKNWELDTNSSVVVENQPNKRLSIPGR